MTRTPRLVVLLALLLAAACSSDAAGPTDARTAALRTTSLLAGPKGYGFRLLGSDQASAIIDGTNHIRCSDFDTGYALFELTLTQKMVDEMGEVLDHGGSVVVESISQHTFTGEGDYSYWEALTIQGLGINGAHSNHASASWPGRPSSVTRMVFEKPVTRQEMGSVVAGSVITVAARARAEGDLGAACGQIAGGQAAWRMRGVVLWLTP